MLYCNFCHIFKLICGEHCKFGKPTIQGKQTLSGLSEQHTTVLSLDILKRKKKYQVHSVIEVDAYV